MQNAAQKKDERYDVDTHFGFGENWADYAKHIEEDKIQKAEEGVFKLVPKETLSGKTWLDIGCGSGLHSLAALRGGIKSAVCVDFDPNSVATTKSVLNAHWDQKNFIAFQQNILEDPGDESLKKEGFEIVYSWGVLHHTGDMWEAITRASAYVAPGGLFVIALYKKTPLCGAWAVEKKLYSALPKWARVPFDYLYACAFCLAKLLLRQNPVKYINEYQKQRGMRFMTDVRDWMGGYPYESASPEEVEAFMKDKGFTLQSSFNAEPSKGLGLFGSGCAEYVFIKS